ncbi:TIGR03936 family radical SAM-associated protein [Brooklawnia cerclae]
MAYSSGFNPHPRISYAGAAPTGTASLAEYVELGLAARCDPERLRDSLAAALPAGFDVVGVIEAEGRALADRMEASAWTIELPGVDERSLAAAAADLLAADRVEVTRRTKNGDRVFDAREAIVSLRVDGDTVSVVLRHGQPLVRPDDLVSALVACAPGLSDDLDAPRSTRLAQGPLGDDGTVVDPFA